MGHMKDLLITIYNGGDEAVAAVQRMGKDWREQLEQAAAEIERRWIPVAERLPPNNDWVLGFQKWIPDVYKCDEGVLACWYWHSKGVWKTCEEYDTLPNVTHWMPLPEPPEVK